MTSKDGKLEMLLNQLRQLDQAESLSKEDLLVDEDGLPVMEIREELDEDGNVISHHVEPQKNTDVKELADKLSQLVQDYDNRSKSSKVTQSTRITEIDEDEKPERKSSMKTPTGPDTTDKLGSIENPDNSTDKKQKKSVQVANPPGVDTAIEPVVKSILKKSSDIHSPENSQASRTSEKDQRQTRTQPSHWGNLNVNDLLELELLADEIDSEEGTDDKCEDGSLLGSESESGLHEDDDNEYDDSDESDEDEYGRTRGTLFPFPLSGLINRKPQALAETSVEEGTINRDRRVSFSDSVEMKTYLRREKAETTSEHESQRISINDKEVSFAENVDVRVFGEAQQGSDSEEGEIEEDAPTVEEQVLERWEEPQANHGMKQPAVDAEPTKPKNSLFKKQRANLSKKLTSMIPDCSAEPIKPQSPILEDGTGLEETIAYARQADGVMSNEVLERAKEHMRLAMISEEDFIEAHGGENDEHIVIPAEKQQHDEEDDTTGVSIVDNIIERDDEPFDLADDSAELSHVSRAEMAREYQRLRRKLIDSSGGFGKTEDERAVETVDETGEPRKVSRFKAAMVGGHALSNGS